MLSDTSHPDPGRAAGGDRDGPPRELIGELMAMARRFEAAGPFAARIECGPAAMARIHEAAARAQQLVGPPARRDRLEQLPAAFTRLLPGPERPVPVVVVDTYRGASADRWRAIDTNGDVMAAGRMAPTGWRPPTKETPS